MAERLSGGNQAIALLGNTIPAGAILVVIITILGPISGGGHHILAHSHHPRRNPIRAAIHSRPVGLVITAAYWFTSSAEALAAGE